MAITEYYCDPAINANSGTGTIGDAFGDLQYALNTITRNATTGDRINIKAGTAEVLAANLSLSTYGSPTSVAPLVIQGYTSAAGDGGRGEISGNGAYSILTETGKTVYFADMKIGNSGSAAILGSSNVAACCVNCEIHTSSHNTPVHITDSMYMTGCYFRNLTGSFALQMSGGIVYGCFFDCAPTAGTAAISVVAGPARIINNTFKLATDTSLHGIYNVSGGQGFLVGNTIYTSTANTSDGIEWQDIRSLVCINNIVYGYSGAGGTGLRLNYFGGTGGFAVIGANAFYNNTTDTAISAQAVYTPAPNDTLAASPFVDAASGDFRINGTVSGVTEDGWPQSWPGLTTDTAPKPDKGAVQAGAGAGGGGRRPRLRIHGV